MSHMAAIPESTRSSVALRLLDHAEQHWPQLHRVQVTSRAGFAYVTGILPDGQQIPLCRLRYGGSAHSFGFAIYSAARARYEDAVLLTGSPVGTPQQALDTACTVHLAGIGHEPPTNLRAHPLKARRPYLARMLARHDLEAMEHALIDEQMLPALGFWMIAEHAQLKLAKGLAGALPAALV